MMDGEATSVSTRLAAAIGGAISMANGWIGFDRFMAMALYEPGLGYYANGLRKFGAMPSSGSDFVTAPELSPLFGQAVARQVAQALRATGTNTVWEFGAGTGALAEQLLASLGDVVAQYVIVDLSGELRDRQRTRLARHGSRVAWADRWPDELRGVVVGNEVLDAMPVRLLHWNGAAWLERGVSCAEDGRLVFADRVCAAAPPSAGPFAPGTVTEIHPQAEAFVTALADRLQAGAAFFIDYGFPEAEYYHPQRTGGTLMCHRAHRADADPLADVGLKDITAHVNFTGIALAGQDAGLDVLGYTTQARFLMNCGLLSDLEQAGLRERAAAQKLLTEHEMGELFKVIAFGRSAGFDPIGFAVGDRTHSL